MKINPAKTITDSLSAKYSKKTEAIRRGQDTRKNIKHLLSISGNNTAQSISEDLEIKIKNVILVSEVSTVKSIAECLGMKEKSLYPLLSSMEKEGDIKKGEQVKLGATAKSNTYMLVEK